MYDEDAMNLVVPAAGRAVRTPTDTGVTYVLDANFYPLYKRTYAPLYFKEAFHWLKNRV